MSKELLHSFSKLNSRNSTRSVTNTNAKRFQWRIQKNVKFAYCETWSTPCKNYSNSKNQFQFFFLQFAYLIRLIHPNSKNNTFRFRWHPFCSDFASLIFNCTCLLLWRRITQWDRTINTITSHINVLIVSEYESESQSKQSRRDDEKNLIEMHYSRSRNNSWRHHWESSSWQLASMV